ncbi:uncharacterized protein CDAR_516231 [Caerostris darwini]|uniref:Uncharacterized protein n=1 Tax=Caerostris darwini TaxID=1538125 RepID=A0AAV4X0J1_9ARAC|nr:uncharacterized protein CDAR_516231 [Caerostris darwini]
MKMVPVLISMLLLLIRSAESGSSCPTSRNFFPCVCTNFDDGFTLIVCPGINNATHLEEVTRPMKSLIVDRLMLLGTYWSDENTDDFLNAVDPKTKIPLNGMFPKNWLSEVRVRHLEIQNAKLNGYFLFDGALEGQTEFLLSLTIKNANLRGHVCSSCGPASGSTAMATTELRKALRLKKVDFSYNLLEYIDGNAFPVQLKELSKVILSNNQIVRVHDNAFSNLQRLEYLDISRNRLKSISRKIFRPSDASLATLDISYNSIQSLPEDIFQNLNALKDLKISHNLLEVLPEKPWTGLPALLDKVDLKGNFLVCNCTLKWIARKLSKATRLVGQCVAPKEVEFQDLKPNLPTITSCS